MANVASNIAANFERFGVKDLLITFGTREHPRAELKAFGKQVTLTTLLSHGMNLFDNGPGNYFPTNLLILIDGVQVGWVDTDTCFHYSKAPDLATFLAYAVACDGGRRQVLYRFSPTGSAKQLQHTLTPLYGVNEPSRELLVRCHKEFKRCLARQFVYQKTTRFSDAHDMYIGTAWQIATRDRFGESIKAPVYYD